MANISVRGLDDELARELKREAEKRDVSMNTLVLQLLYRGMGLPVAEKAVDRFHDLDDLAGTWSEEDAREFETAVKSFEGIDEDLWR